MINLKYSIDKVKIRIDNLRLQEVQGMMDKLSVDPYVFTSYESNKMSKCRYNYLIGEGEGAVYVGVAPNWIKEEKNIKSVVLEYNPNKVCPWFYESLELLVWSNIVNWCVMSVDIACDIMEEYSSLVMLKRDKREYFAKIGHSEVETQYLGAFGENGHIKFYDKAKERKVDYPWSRFEITLKGLKDVSCSYDYFKEFCKVPTVYKKGCFDDVKDIERIVLSSMVDDIENLYSIKRYETRKKYEKLLAQFLNLVGLDVYNMYETYIKFFKTIFDFTPKEGIKSSHSVMKW